MSNIIFKVNYFFSISETIKKDIIKIGIKVKFIHHRTQSVYIRLINSKILKDINKKIYLITVTRFAKSKKGLDMIPKIAEILIKKKLILNGPWLEKICIKYRNLKI